jgi:two-component system chemotaxis sensor kinase CheA
MPFDVDADELNILLAESEEHLQTLDEGLVQIEAEGGSPELLQAIFRAVHTLKGLAGVINHWRMADLTHAMETVLDNLRRGALTVSPAIVDVCLEALDALKALHQEMVDGESAPIDIAPLVTRLLSFSQPLAAGAAATEQTAEEDASGLFICAEIAPDCMAPAARAFQVVLALQSLGEVHDLQPPLSVIESAAPVRRVSARLNTRQPVATLSRALTSISDLTQITIDGQPLAAPAVKAVSGSAAPARPADEAPASARAARPNFHDKTVRTSVERLDNLMNLVGELITDRNRLHQLQADFENRRDGHDQVENLAQTVLHLSRLTDQLQDEVMRIRMLPIANVFNKLPRVVRDLARKAGKQVELVMRGADTELDRSVIEAIGDPLIHLLRNAVDHGLETPAERLAAGKTERGIVVLTARHEESRIVVTVEDDGRGIDLKRVTASAIQKGLISEAEAASLTRGAALNLIFMPGLSTAPVVSEVSGRGVGMDIVRTNIEQLNGHIRVETWAGQGTRFHIVLPLTLAIMPTLLVRGGAVIYALPLMAVMETLRLPAQAIRRVNGRAVTQVRDHVLPLVSLPALLHLPQPEQTRPHEYVVAVRWGNLDMGLLVDSLIGEQEMVVKTMGPLMGDTPGIAGASILGDGRVALILDVAGLFKLASTH